MLLDASASTDRTGRPAPDAGFTLVEVLIALMLLSIMALGVANLFGIAIRATSMARHQTTTATLAAQKMEQLRSLDWGFDAAGQGLPVSDTSTDLSREPATNTGNGLNPSPVGALDANLPGYVDYLDVRGNWVGTGTQPPANAMFIRRWSIEPLPTNPNNTLIFQVLVTTVVRERGFTAMPGSSRGRLASDALIVSVKTRKSR
jgi:prepilin-type N-terminal cleavage/methylation domain-containing protein